MKGISGELLFLLIFAAFIIGPQLLQWLRKNKEKWQDDLQTPGDQQPQDAETDELPFLRSPAPGELPAPEIIPDKNKSRRGVAPEVAPATSRKRFSRETLFGNKRRTQDAVVVAMILGPCRADVLHDNMK